MKGIHCDQEAAVVQASRSGGWTSDMRRHVSRCSVCADAVLVAEFLEETNRLSEAELVSLPSSEFLWWKSQLRAKQRAMNQATRPIEFLKVLAYAAGSVTLLWFLVNPPQATGLSRYSAHLQQAFSEAGRYALLGAASSLLAPR
jgi:hypothetical protein